MKRLVATCVLSIGLLVAAAPQADAALRLRIEDLDTGEGIVLTDGATGDANSVTGAVTYVGSVGQFVVNVTTGISKPLIGGVNNYAELHLDNVSINTNGAGSLRIVLQDTDFVGGPDGPMSFVSEIVALLTAPTGSTVFAQSYVDPTNAVIDLGLDTHPAGALAALGATPPTSLAGFGLSGVTSGPGPFNAANAIGFAKDGPYSMTVIVVVTFSGSGSVSFDAGLQTIPEPATISMWAFGLLGCAAVTRLRRRKA